MLTVFTQSVNIEREIARALHDEEVRTVKNWRELSRRAPQSDCIVLALPRLNRNVTLRLRHLRRFNASPVVLITDGVLENARRLKDVTVEEVLWTDEVPTRIEYAVRCARAGSLLTVITEALRANLQISPLLRRALIEAVTRDRPYRTVKALAEETGRSRTTLWHHWNQFAPELQLQRLLDWILLLRAIQQRQSRSWTVVAHDLGLSISSLNRIAKRTTGDTLAELGAAGFKSAFAVFRKNILDKRLKFRIEQFG